MLAILFPPSILLLDFKTFTQQRSNTHQRPNRHNSGAGFDEGGEPLASGRKGTLNDESLLDMPIDEEEERRPFLQTQAIGDNGGPMLSLF